MVGMIVGDKHRQYPFERDAFVLKAFADGADAYTRIDKYAVRVGTQIIAVAAAATGQTHKLYFHSYFFWTANIV